MELSVFNNSDVNNYNNYNIEEFYFETENITDFIEDDDCLKNNNVDDITDFIIGGNDDIIEIDLSNGFDNGLDNQSLFNNNITGGSNNNVNNNVIGGNNDSSKDDPIKESVHAKIVPDTVSECSLVSNSTGVCSSSSTIQTIKEDLNINAQTPDEVIAKAKEITKCDTERCVIEKIDDSDVKKELETNFKLAGPTGIELLNNYNIDNTLKQWKLKFPKFYAYNFNMRDFKREQDTLATVDVYNDIYKKNYDVAACVINSDVYSGSGIHWMALLCDFRNPKLFTVEFFNSSGQMPSQEFNAWLYDTKNNMLEAGKPIEVVKVCNVKQQNSRTECGVYSLYYIWARLNNIPYTFFQSHRIEDQKMFEFRQHLFHNNSSAIKPGESFDFEKFAGTYNPKWESGHKP